jgi:hypothetical protein
MKLLVTTHRLNGHNQGDVIDLDDTGLIEYLIASGQCVKVEDDAPKPVTKAKAAATKVLRKKRKD